MILHTDVPTRAQLYRLLASREPWSVSIYLPTDPSSRGEAERLQLKIIIVRYNPLYALSPTFTPIKSATDLDAAEAAGNVFLPINPQASNPYEIETGNVLICPTVSPHA